MKLISEEKVNDASNKYAVHNYKYHENATAHAIYGSAMDFKAGIKFAESELQNLAIEFSEWKDKNYRRYSDKDIYLSNFNKKDQPHDLKYIFEKFISQRNKSNT